MEQFNESQRTVRETMTDMSLFLRVKLNKADGQMIIDKHRVAALMISKKRNLSKTLLHCFYKGSLILTNLYSNIEILCSLHEE